MIRVSILYANTPGARFDHDYYRTRHIPMVVERLGAACHSFSIDKGIAGGAPGTGPTYVAMASLVVDSIAAFAGAMAPHQAEVSADIASYTDIQPLIQFSEIVVG